MDPILALTIAAAGLWRGLTAEETEQVAAILEPALEAEGPTISASRAHELLTETIASVVEASRGAIF